MAAYAVLLQAFFGSALLGQSLGPALLDKAIHLTLCAPGAEGVPKPDDASIPHLPACCQSGCSALGVAYAAPPAKMLLLGSPARSSAPTSFHDPAPPGLPGHDRLAGRPRGPPSLV